MCQANELLADRRRKRLAVQRVEQRAQSAL